MYALLWQKCGMLPDRLAKQNPRLLFDMLDEPEEEEIKPEEMNPHLRMFYGF